jgi:hypothetical protein
VKEGAELIAEEADHEVRDAGLISAAQRVEHCRVEEWRGGDRRSVSTPRSSNRTCGFPASGFRTRVLYAFAHGRLTVRASNRRSPSLS